MIFFETSSWNSLGIELIIILTLIIIILVELRPHMIDSANKLILW